MWSQLPCSYRDGRQSELCRSLYCLEESVGDLEFGLVEFFKRPAPDRYAFPQLGFSSQPPHETGTPLPPLHCKFSYQTTTKRYWARCTQPIYPPLNSSGAMYAGVPAPACAAVFAASPKSHNFTFHARSSKKLAGLMSRWMTNGRRVWRYHNARTMSSATCCTLVELEKNARVGLGKLHIGNLKLGSSFGFRIVMDRVRRHLILLLCFWRYGGIVGAHLYTCFFCVLLAMMRPRA